MSKLRNVAVAVSESQLGRFEWVLMESSGDDIWAELASSKTCLPTWQAAFAAGCFAIAELLPNQTVCMHHGFGS